MKLSCYLFLCVFACKYFYVTHMSLVPRGQKKALDTLETKLQML